MSKIFDALQGTRSEVSELLPGLIAEESAAAGRAIVKPGRGGAPDVGPTIPDSAPSPTPVPGPASRPGATQKLIRRLPVVVSASAPLLPFQNSHDPAAEQYRIARTKISHHPKKPKMIVIGSASPGDGKTITAINLAAVLSLKSEARVLLIDADFRRPALHSQLGMPKTPGLAETIAGKCAFEDAVVQAEQFPNLHFLASGELEGVNPSELLDSQSWHALCRVVRSRYQYIILDSPPVSAVADFDLIQMAADGTILVVRPDHTKRSACFKALETISKEKLLGVLLNCEEHWFLNRSDSYGYHYHYSGSASTNGQRGKG